MLLSTMSCLSPTLLHLRRATSLASHTDKMPKTQRHISSRAVWWMGGPKTLIKNCVVETGGISLPVLSSPSGACEECRNVLGQWDWL